MSATVDQGKIEAFDENRTIHNKKLLIKSLLIFGLVIFAFITHHWHKVSLATVALGGGFIMMMVTKQDPEEMLKEVEWPTLFFFLGLFVMVGALEKTGIIRIIADRMVEVSQGNPAAATQLVLWVSSLSTTVVNSIPYTATMISVIENMAATMPGDINPLWWALSIGACFGGNGTIIGAAANIIVAGFTQKTKYPLRFKEYVKIGFPLMLVSVILASAYLYFRFFII